MKKLLTSILLIVNIFLFTVPSPGYANSHVSKNPSISYKIKSCCSNTVEGVVAVTYIVSLLYLSSKVFLNSVVANLGDNEW